MKFLKSFLVAVIVMTAASNAAFSQAANTAKTANDAKTMTVKVKGVTCSMDLKMISANVEKLNGVSSCKTAKQGTTTTFDVTYNPALVKEKDIFAAVEGTGSCEKPDERPYKVKQ